MGNPILFVKDAGHGETPACPNARFKPGDIVNPRRRNTLPDEMVVLVAVPPGFPADYALADLMKEPRPLMISKPERSISYVLCKEGDPKAYHALERQLKDSGKEPVEIGTVSRAPE